MNAPATSFRNVLIASGRGLSQPQTLSAALPGPNSGLLGQRVVRSASFASNGAVAGGPGLSSIIRSIDLGERTIGLRKVAPEAQIKVITAKLKLIDGINGNLRSLVNAGRVTAEALNSDPLLRRAVEGCLEQIIECVIGISRRGANAPPRLFTAEQAVRAYVNNASIAHFLPLIAARNKLAHEYENVKTEELLALIGEIEHVTSFKRAVLSSVNIRRPVGVTRREEVRLRQNVDLLAASPSVEAPDDAIMEEAASMVASDFRCSANMSVSSSSADRQHRLTVNERVRVRLAYMRQILDELASWGEITSGRLNREWMLKRAVTRNMEVLCQLVFDLSCDLLSCDGRKVADEKKRDVILRCVELCGLPSGRSYTGTVAMRRNLAHYAEQLGAADTKATFDRHYHDFQVFCHGIEIFLARPTTPASPQVAPAVPGPSAAGLVVEIAGQHDVASETLPCTGREDSAVPEVADAVVHQSEDGAAADNEGDSISEPPLPEDLQEIINKLPEKSDRAGLLQLATRPEGARLLRKFNSVCERARRAVRGLFDSDREAEEMAFEIAETFFRAYLALNNAGVGSDQAEGLANLVLTNYIKMYLDARGRALCAKDAAKLGDDAARCMLGLLVSLKQQSERIRVPLDQAGVLVVEAMDEWYVNVYCSAKMATVIEPADSASMAVHCFVEVAISMIAKHADLAQARELAALTTKVWADDFYIAKQAETERGVLFLIDILVAFTSSVLIIYGNLRSSGCDHRKAMSVIARAVEAAEGHCGPKMRSSKVSLELAVLEGFVLENFVTAFICYLKEIHGNDALRNIEDEDERVAFNVASVTVGALLMSRQFIWRRDKPLEGDLAEKLCATIVESVRKAYLALSGRPGITECNALMSSLCVVTEAHANDYLEALADKSSHLGAQEKLAAFSAVTMLATEVYAASREAGADHKVALGISKRVARAHCFIYMFGRGEHAPLPPARVLAVAESHIRNLFDVFRSLYFVGERPLSYDDGMDFLALMGAGNIYKFAKRNAEDDGFGLEEAARIVRLGVADFADVFRSLLGTVGGSLPAKVATDFLLAFFLHQKVLCQRLRGGKNINEARLDARSITSVMMITYRAQRQGNYEHAEAFARTKTILGSPAFARAVGKDVATFIDCSEVICK